MFYLDQFIADCRAALVDDKSHKMRDMPPSRLAQLGIAVSCECPSGPVWHELDRGVAVWLVGCGSRRRNCDQLSKASHV